MSTHLPSAFADYVPVELRHRHDGWTPMRQVDFLLALSESAFVEHACRAVGQSSRLGPKHPQLELPGSADGRPWPVRTL